MSNCSIIKKKEPLNDTFFNLCKDLLRFIDRKIIKKYISPNVAQIPKEMRNSENKNEKENKKWTYFFKDKELTEEDEIKDVFKDDKFLSYLQNLTNSLIIVVDYLEQNQKKIKRLEDDIKNKEEKLNTLNELKNLLNNYFDKNNEEDKTKIENKKNNNILEDKNLLNIMNKIQSFNSNQDNINTKITQNVIDINNLNTGNNNIDNNSKYKINLPSINNNIINIIDNKSKIKEKNYQKEDNNNTNNTYKKEKNTPRDNNKDKENEILFDISNQCLSAPNPYTSHNNNNEGIKNEPNSKDKNEIDILIDNFKINNNLFDKQIKKEINENIKNKDSQSEESYHFFKIKNKEEDKSQNNQFLSKKLERESEKEINTNIKEITNNDIINIEKLISEKKKGKNKKKKSTNKDSLELDNENSNQIPLKEEISNLPVLRPRLNIKKDIINFEPESKEKKIKNNIKESKSDITDINEDVVQLLLEDYENNNKEKEKEKEKDKNNNISKNTSLELEFDSIINKQFSELNPRNNKTKLLKDILYSIKTNKIKNYNPRINGPYLVGSYKIITELPCINYSSDIDILYTYKDILVDKKIIDFSINNLIKNDLNLNIIETSENLEDNNKIIKIKVKCDNKFNINLSFNFFFVDLEQNEKLINNIIFNNEKIEYEDKEEHKKFVNIILYLRTWRKKNKLLFIIPEIMDAIAKKNFDKNKTIGLIILNVFYDLYNGIIDFNSRINQGVLPKHKTLMENLIKNWFDNEKNHQTIKDAVLQTNKLINDKNFSALF